MPDTTTTPAAKTESKTESKPVRNAQGRTGRTLNIDDLANEIARRDTEGYHAAAKAATAAESQARATVVEDTQSTVQDEPSGLVQALTDNATTFDASDESGEDGVEPIQTQAGAISSLSDLAAALDIPMETLLTLRAATKVDGQEVTVPLSETLSSFRQQKHITQQSQEFAREREAARKAEAERATEWDRRLAQTTQTLEVAKKAFLAEVAKEDWDKLRAEDPNEFILRRYDYDKKREVLNEAIGEHQKMLQQRTEEMRGKQAEREKQEYEALLNAVPEWGADTALMRKEAEQIKAYATSVRGFSGQDLGAIDDHRIMLVLRDAARFHAMRTHGVRSVPNPSAPAMRSAPRTAGIPLAAKALSNARAALKRSGGDAEVAAMLAAKRAGKPKAK